MSTAVVSADMTPAPAAVPASPAVVSVANAESTWYGRIAAITEREIQATFLSPIAYVVIAVFLALLALVNWGGLFVAGQPALIGDLLLTAAIIMVFTLPLITMRLISEEYRSGSIESLMTAPINDVDVVLGKFLGTTVFFLAMLASTLIYPLALIIGGSPPDFGAAFTGYLGLLLVGMLYISIGMLFSALTRHQLIAGLLTILTLGLLTLLSDYLMQNSGLAWLRTFLNYASVPANFRKFQIGQFDPTSAVFFLAYTFFFLLATTKVLESRRWR